MPVPNKLYKYVTFDRLDVLKNECIRFTQPAALNDPRELNPYVEALMSKETFERDLAQPLLDNLTEEGVVQFAIEEWEKMPSFERGRQPGGLPAFKKKTRRYFQKNPEHLAQILNGARQRADKIFTDYNPIDGKIFMKTWRESFGVLSLTAKVDNDAMWAHYAANNEGMLIEFDTNHSFFNRQLSADNVARPIPVFYTDQLPAFQSLEDLIELGNPKALEALTATKKSNWNYEEEWRLVRFLPSADKTIEAKPHSIHLFNLPAAAITGVVVGAQMPRTNRDIITKFIASDGRYGHVTLSEVVMSSRTFALDIKPLQ